MKIGRLNIGLDSTTTEPVKSTPKARTKGTINEVLGGMLETSQPTLSSEKTISPKILRAYGGWIYKNNDVIAKEVANMEFELFSIGLKDGEIVYNKIDEHPLLDLLDQMNDTTTKSDGLYITQSHKKLTGDSFWLLERNGRAITAIYQLQPDKIELELGDPTVGEPLVKAYEYTDVIDDKRITKVYKPEDIIHFKTPNPRNMFRGYGAVEAASDIIDLDNLSVDTQKKFFKNGAISNFVLTSPNKLQQDQIKRLEQQMKKAYGGSRNAFKTMIFGSGLEPKDISFSNKDMQMLDQLEWYRDFLMTIFGNTKASLGIIDDVNRASHESSIIEWKRNSVKPEKDSIINTLNEFLVPQFGDKLILGYKNDIPEDRTDDITESTILYNAGIVTLNEARGMLDLDPDPAGDDRKQPVQPVAPPQDEPQKVYHKSKIDKKLPAALRHIDINTILRKRKMFTQLRINREVKEAAKPFVKQMFDKKKVVKEEAPRLHAQFTNDKVMGYYEKQMSIVDVLENQFEESVAKFIDKIETQVLESLPGEISKDFVVKALFNEEQLLTEAQIDLAPILLKEAVVAGQEAYKLIGKDDPYIPFQLEKKIRKNVDKFTQSMLDTDQERLSKLIANGIKEGLSVPQITDSITEAFDTIRKTQSQVITRTEVLRTSNLAAQDAFEQSGVVEAKQWLTAPGADEDCAVYEGKIVKLGGNFYDAEGEFEDGDPPLHPNCRCAILPIVEGTKAYQPAPVHEKILLEARIKELEDKVDKRTKAFKELKNKSIDDEAYIKSLEALL